MEHRELREKEYVHTYVCMYVCMYVCTYLLLTKRNAASDSSIFPRRRLSSNVTTNIHMNVLKKHVRYTH